MRIIHVFSIGLILTSSLNLESKAAELEGDALYSLSRENPKMRFHKGEAKNNQPSISEKEPKIDGPLSDWHVGQWQQSSYIGAENLTEYPLESFDPVLGKAKYAFSSQDNHSHIWIYPNAKSWVYELYEENGKLSSAGGSNLFLTNGNRKPNAAFDKEITLFLKVKLSNASRTSNKGVTASSDALLSQAFTGLGLLFNNPTTHTSQFVFMQLPIASSRTSVNKGFKACTLSGSEPHLLFIPKYDDGENMLPFRASSEPPQSISYRLNHYVSQLVDTSYECNKTMYSWPTEAVDLRNWSITFIYIGLETQSRDDRIASPSQGEQGRISTGLQIFDLSVTKSRSSK